MVADLLRREGWFVASHQHDQSISQSCFCFIYGLRVRNHPKLEATLEVAEEALGLAGTTHAEARESHEATVTLLG
jgi:hypothetical protein